MFMHCFSINDSVSVIMDGYVASALLEFLVCYNLEHILQHVQSTGHLVELNKQLKWLLKLVNNIDGPSKWIEQSPFFASTLLKYFLQPSCG